MLEVLLTAIGLGIAGLDPVGALIAIGALSSGARNRTVVAYGITIIVVTVVTGTVISKVAGARLAAIDWSFLDAGYEFWALGEVIVGVALIGWASRKLLLPTVEEAEPKKRGIGAIALLSAGFLFGIGAVLDPTFVALAVVAGRHGSVLDVSLVHLVWILLSQSPLVVIVGAVLTNKHEPVIRRLQTWRQKARPAIGKTGIVFALVTGVTLLADAGWWFVTDEFLLDF